MDSTSVFIKFVFWILTISILFTVNTRTMSSTPMKTQSPEPECPSPALSTQSYIDVPRKVLRQLPNRNSDDIVSALNAYLDDVKLLHGDRIASRLRNEAYRTAASYRKLKSGQKKIQFDKKISRIAVEANEVGTQNALTAPATPATQNALTAPATPATQNVLTAPATPATQNALTAPATPATQNALTAPATPATQNALTAPSTPLKQNAPNAQATPVTQNAPITPATPVKQNAPNVQATPVTQNAPTTPTTTGIRVTQKPSTTETNHVLTNTGKTRLDNCSKRNKPRVLKKLENSVGKSLEFMETFGALPQKLVCESFDGSECILNLDGCSSQNVSYENMSSVEKQRVRSMLDICDSTMLSDAVYHELSMKLPSVPRTHHLQACRREVNETFDIKRTPGMIPGAYMSVTGELQQCVKERLKAGEDPNKPLQIKISGDGARVSRVSNFIVVSFSVIDSTNASHINQRVIAIVECQENYENLKRSLAPLFEEINELSKTKCIYIPETDTRVPLELFVGGDMKFIQILLGLNGSLAVYACPWCKVPKDTRGDITLPWDFYHQTPQCRTIDQMQRPSSGNAKENFGSKHLPLLNIEVDHYVIDELHLLLRITDVMLKNVIDDAMSKDQEAKLHRRPSDNVDSLCKAIESCGVSFKIWTNRAGETEYTSLTGSDKRKVLKNLPEKMFFYIHEDTRDDVIQLWVSFEKLYLLITGDTDQMDGLQIFTHAHQFIKDFLAIGEKQRIGYQSKNVTPYMHALVYHVPFFVDRYGSLAKFSGQGVEKTNDVIKKIHQTKSNKLDATKDALLVRKRQELAFHYQQSARTRRAYSKRDDLFWNSKKTRNAKELKDKIRREMEEADFNEQPPLDPEVISTEEIKSRLRGLGVTTKLRRRDKLLSLLQSTLNTA